MVALEPAEQLVLSLYQFSVQSVWTVGIPPDALIEKLWWHLSADVAVVRGLPARLRLHQLVTVDELTCTGCVVFGVLDAFLVDFPRLRKFALSTHLINNLQVTIDLIGRRKACHVGPSLYLLVKVLCLGPHVELLGSVTIEVDALVIKSIKVARHVREALLAFLGKRRAKGRVVVEREVIFVLC